MNKASDEDLNYIIRFQTKSLIQAIRIYMLVWKDNEDDFQVKARSDIHEVCDELVNLIAEIEK